jgi:hypothetical protein
MLNYIVRVNRDGMVDVIFEDPEQDEENSQAHILLNPDMACDLGRALLTAGSIEPHDDMSFPYEVE